MAFALYVFRFAPGGALVRVPLSRWDRIEREGEPCPECAGQTVRFAYVCVELHRRRPIAVRRIEGVVRHFDEHGALVLPRVPAANEALHAVRRQGNVVDISGVLQQRRYWESYRWLPTAHDVKRLIAAIEHALEST